MPARKHLEKLKENEKLRQQINRICMYLSIVMPLTAMPQVIKLFTSQNAGGLSLIMWVMGGLGVLPFIFYGFMHNMKQLVVLNSLWLVVNCVMVTGIVIYS